MSTDTGWSALSGAERESFFAAIARHRSAAWRVTAVSRLVNLAVALVVAVLMSPLFYACIALALDVVNLAVPTPNIITPIGAALDQVLNRPTTLTTGHWLAIGLWAALPGLVWMGFVLSALRRVLTLSMQLHAGELAARAPDITVLAEQRFNNVVAEMAIAASLPQPQVLLINQSEVDAAAFGVDEQHSTVVISQGLLALLNRAQLEGVAADLVGSIANGDIRIGLRAGLSLSLFSMIARLGTLVTQRNARQNVSRVVLATLWPTAASARMLVSELGDPMAADPATAAAPAAPGALDSLIASLGLTERWEKLRPYLWLPLIGPVVLTGFLTAIVNLFVLGPLLSLAWRQRKYMADATAVRLTRDPDTLAGALEQMSQQRRAAIAPWAAHMSVVDHAGRQRGLFTGNAVPMFPSIERRLRGLAGMGAQVRQAPGRKIPLRLWFIIVPLVSVLAVLVAMLLPLLVWLSLACTMLFGGIPFAIVHMLLRWLGHH